MRYKRYKMTFATMLVRPSRRTSKTRMSNNDTRPLPVLGPILYPDTI